MSRFVAAVLVATDAVTKASVDPRTPGTEGLGPVEPAARLASAFASGRKQRAADDELITELAAALRVVPGVDAARDAGHEAWRTRQQRREAGS